MVIIKRQKIKAYILLEGLIAFGLLVTIALLILEQIANQRQVLEMNLARQEALNVAQMAIQTKQDQLKLNGVSVRVEKGKQGVVVYHEQEEILRLVQE